MATWYVRPDASHGGTNDGTSYANAFQGWASIIWGTASGVRGSTNDTLYVCGTFNTASITVGAHGGASTAQIATIRGDYALDPGSIVLTGSAFVTAPRSYTTYTNLIFVGGTASSIVFFSGASLQYVSFQGCSFSRPTANGNGLSFDGANGNNYSNITVNNCSFTGDFRNTTNATGAFNWLVSAAAAVSTMSTITITNNTFTDAIFGRSAIHMRIQSTASASSRMNNVKIENNTFKGIFGCCIEVNDNHTTFGNSAGLLIKNNNFTDIKVTPVDTAMGGCILAWGFTSTTEYGIPIIENNRAMFVTGAIGFADCFYGNYIVRYNYVDTISTNTIDGNGVLFDFSCNNCVAYGNDFNNLLGSTTGATNAGVAIMVLSSTNILCHSNKIIKCKTGIFFGDAGGGQSATIINNTFVDCLDYGVNLRSVADPTNLICKNNIFIAVNNTSIAVNNDSTSWTGEDYNIFYNFSAPVNHSFGTNTLTTAPLLYPSLIPRSTSPAKKTGVYLNSFFDFNLIFRNNPPSRGAFEYIPERPVATIRGVR